VISIIVAILHVMLISYGVDDGSGAGFYAVEVPPGSQSGPLCQNPQRRFLMVFCGKDSFGVRRATVHLVGDSEPRWGPGRGMAAGHSPVTQCTRRVVNGPQRCGWWLKK
jgi:hypothetical protein